MLLGSAICGGEWPARSLASPVRMRMADITDDGSSFSTRPDGVGVADRAGSRRPLDQNLIIREAVRFIDEFGRDRLTMRRLGARLGVEAMALYRYVPGREQLLDGVVEAVMDELYHSTMTGDYAESWQEFLEKMAHGVLNRHGLSSDDSVIVYRAFSTFLLGHLLLETAVNEPTSPPASEDVEFYESNDMTNYPLLRGLESQLSQDMYADEFEDSLEGLINRIELGRS